jgi:ribonuclease E|tara:strand:- start:504 stop:1763 length:1260 start_codon:yes stop_codon:yes gene_type:complete
MTKYIIVEKKRNIGILFTNCSVEEILNIDSKYNVGDIYLGIVTNILENLNIAFIKLDNWKQNGFLVLKNEFFFTSRPNINLGEEIVVEIIKEQISKKGPTVTKNISVQNEEIKIYPYNKKSSSISKSFNKKDTKYLNVVTRLIKSKNFGLNIEKREGPFHLWKLIYRLKKVQQEYLSIQKKINNSQTLPCLVSNKQEIVDILLKKSLIQKETIIIVSSLREAIKTKKKLLSKTIKKDKVIIEYSREKISKNYEYYVEFIVRNALRSNVKLNTGGHIVIEKTEALTSIDVNSGSFKKFRSSRETILWINLAATKTIIQELKLRNIGGIIVIDFIGMINQNDQLSLLEYLNTQLQSNLPNGRIIQISEIGLVEITKTREGRNIYDMFTQECRQCKGTGYIREEKLSNKFHTHFLEVSSIYG